MSVVALQAVTVARFSFERNPQGAVKRQRSIKGRALLRADPPADLRPLEEVKNV